MAPSGPPLGAVFPEQPRCCSSRPSQFSSRARRRAPVGHLSSFSAVSILEAHGPADALAPQFLEFFPRDLSLHPPQSQLLPTIVLGFTLLPSTLAPTTVQPHWDLQSIYSPPPTGLWLLDHFTLLSWNSTVNRCNDHTITSHFTVLGM